MVISVTYATNISSAGVHLAKFTPFLPHFNKNCLEKNFFPSPWGGAPAPPAPPWLRLWMRMRCKNSWSDLHDMYLWTRKITLNFESHPHVNPNLGSSYLINIAVFHYLAHTSEDFMRSLDQEVPCKIFESHPDSHSPSALVLKVSITEAVCFKRWVS